MNSGLLLQRRGRRFWLDITTTSSSSPSAPLIQAWLARVELASAKGLPAARGALAQARPNAIVGAGANGNIFTGAARRARRHVEPLLYY